MSATKLHTHTKQQAILHYTKEFQEKGYMLFHSRIDYELLLNGPQSK